MARQSERPGGFDPASMASFFEADSLAVIGASADPLKQGGRPVGNSRQAGFGGKIYPINPRADIVQGVKAYPSLDAVDAPVESAFIALPAPAIEQAVLDCADKGVKAATVISAGFAETGRAGRRRQSRIVDIARAAGMRLIGPNCMGLMNTHRKLYATFLGIFRDADEVPPPPGPLSLISQSGAVGAHIYVLAQQRGVGLAKWVTTGNQCDVQVADCMAYMATDAETKVITVYMEGCGDAESFKYALDLARRNRKPVIILKVGSSDVGGRATLSHTGSLAGSDAAFDGLCAQYGVYRARDIGELLDVATACMAGIYPMRKAVGLVTISGGMGALMADRADEMGLAVPPLPGSAQKELLEHFPFGATRNPVDPTALWSQDMTTLSHGLEVLLGAGKHEVVVVFASTIGTMEMQIERFRSLMPQIRQKNPDRVIILSMVTPPEVKTALEADGFLVYEEASRAMEVAAALIGFAPMIHGKNKVPKTPRVAKKLTIRPDGAMSEPAAMDILEAAGIPFVRRRLATSASGAAAAAAKLGFPAVLKIASPDIAHKSEIHGVVVNLASRKETSAAFKAVTGRAKRKARRARIEGALVAPMISDGVECIIGSSLDPGLGPVIMFGMGGIYVEVYKDVAFRVAPFGPAVALDMIREIKGYPILTGARGGPAADIAALAKALSRLSVFAAANAETIQGIDINPFRVLAKGKGALGLDALIQPVG